MTIAEAEQSFVNGLEPIYPLREIKSLFFFWLNVQFRLSQTDLILQKDKPLATSAENDLVTIITRLKKKEPIQYILEQTTFLDLPLRIKPGVLIPRPETEELTGHIIKEHTGIQSLRLLDIGTGSGCIAVSLAKYLDATVFATDKSLQALTVASENAALNSVKVSFLPSDILTEQLNEPDKLNIIVSNPPYVLNSEKAQMDINVLDYEPEEALFVPDNDPLLFYRQIVLQAKNLLLPYGKLFFEINETQGKNLKNLLVENSFTDIILWQDIHGKDRFIQGTYGK